MKWFFTELAQNFAKFLYCFKSLWSNRKLRVMLIPRVRVNINGTRRLIRVSYQYWGVFALSLYLLLSCFIRVAGTGSNRAAVKWLAKVIPTTNHNRRKQSDEPIRIPTNYPWLAQSAGKIARVRCDGLCFSLLKRLARSQSRWPQQSQWQRQLRHQFWQSF